MKLTPMRAQRPIGRCFHEVLEKRLALSVNAPTVTDVTLAGTDWTPAFVQYLSDNEFGSGGYSIPVGGLDQELTIPWRNVDQIRVSFSEDVHIDASDLTVTGINQTQYTISEFDYFPEYALAVWTLESHLPVDRVGIRLNADGLDPITDLGGTALDGEWVNSSSSYVSGDGVAGGDFEFIASILPGDSDRDGDVDLPDLDTLGVNYGTTSGADFSMGDFDGDGDVDLTDLNTLSAVGSTPPVGDPFALGAAPTTTGFDLLSIDDDAGDVIVSLFDVFEDAEDLDSEMSYALVSNSDPTLFDEVVIDEAIGALTLNAAAGASGRAELVFSATDTQSVSVQTTLTVDVDRSNAVPSLIAWSTDLGLGQWMIEGEVSDSDDDLDELYASLIGISPSRVSVAENGYFYLVVLLEPGEIFFVDASVSDGVSTSNTVYLEVG